MCGSHALLPNLWATATLIIITLIITLIIIITWICGWSKWRNFKEERMIVDNIKEVVVMIPRPSHEFRATSLDRVSSSSYIYDNDDDDDDELLLLLLLLQLLVLLLRNVNSTR